MSLLTYLSGYEGTINDKTMSWLRTWSPWMPNGTMEDLWMAFLQGYQGSLNDRMLAWARATSGLSGGSLNDALLGLPDGGAQYGGASLGLYFDEDKYESGAVGAQPISKPFGDIITFTRPSGGGRFNSSGVYEYVGSNVPRLDYDPVTLAPRGLLIEEQRTNLLTYSSDFSNAVWAKGSSSISADSALAPDGTMTADKLVMAVGADPSSTNNIGITNFNRVDSGTSVSSLSFFAKAGEVSSLRVRENISTGAFLTVDLSTGAITNGNSTQFGSPIAVNCGNGWWRISFTTAVGSTSGSRFGLRSNAVGDGASGVYIWGAQFEAGAFPTSYIPTVASQVTRSADVASVNTLSPWYNASEGTLFVESTRFASLPANTPLVIFNGTGTNLIRIRGDGAGYIYDVYNNDSLIAALGAPSGQNNKVAIVYQDNYFNISSGGLIATPDTSGIVPIVSALLIGRHPYNSNLFNGHIQSLEYYPRRLSNTELQEITA